MDSTNMAPMNDAGGSMNSMTDTGQKVLGLDLVAFLMFASGIFYLVCSLLLLKAYRKDKNELLGALLAFLTYQAVAMFFMGLQIQTMNMSYQYIATLAVFIGSVYMLKFPFSSFAQTTRRILFGLSLVIVIGLFAWFMQSPEKQALISNFTIYYDIVVNGIFVGGSIIYFGLKTKERSTRIKSLGGGTGVVSCCVVSNVAMLGGALITSSVFQFAAPVIILGTLAITRNRQS